MIAGGLVENMIINVFFENGLHFLGLFGDVGVTSFLFCVSFYDFATFTDNGISFPGKTA